MKMTVKRKRGAEDTELILSSVKQIWELEDFTDCVVYSSEGIAVRTHRAILSSQSPVLAGLLRGQACCRGGCGQAEEAAILLPEVNYSTIDTVLEFFYTGELRECGPDTALAGRVEALLRLLGVDCAKLQVRGAPVARGTEQNILDSVQSDLSITQQRLHGDAVEEMESGERKADSDYSGGLPSEPESNDEMEVETTSNGPCQVAQDPSRKGAKKNEANKRKRDDADPGEAKKRSRPRCAISDKRQCRICQKIIAAFKFEGHVVTHCYDWWKNLGESHSGTWRCRGAGCDFESKKKNLYIRHLAIRHSQLKSKMAERTESLSDYEMEFVENDDDNETLRVLTSNSTHRVKDVHRKENLEMRNDILTNDKDNRETLENAVSNPKSTSLNEVDLNVNASISELLQDSQVTNSIFGYAPETVCNCRRHLRKRTLNIQLRYRSQFPARQVPSLSSRVQTRKMMTQTRRSPGRERVQRRGTGWAMLSPSDARSLYVCSNSNITIVFQYSNCLTYSPVIFSGTFQFVKFIKLARVHCIVMELFAD